MKKIQKTISILLSGVIIGLGFGSCGTQKIAKEIAEKEQLLKEKEAECAKMQYEIKNLNEQHSKLKRHIEQLKNPPLVYAPPVPSR